MMLLITFLLTLGLAAIVPWMLIGAINGLFDTGITHNLMNYVFAWVILFVIRAPVIVKAASKND